MKQDYNIEEEIIIDQKKIQEKDQDEIEITNLRAWKSELINDILAN